jgi:prepilin-type N-terminal cleavage/methylation domain-containing protein
MRLRRKTTRGFTLVEIAVVLVVIGLLLGGLLRATQLTVGARVRDLAAQQDAVRTAYYGFYERYRAIPGDYSQAIANIKGATQNGNGNGRIEAGATPNETILEWEHLARAGYVNGSYTYAPTESDASSFKSKYGGYVKIAFDGLYGAGTDTTPSTLRHNIKTGPNIPVEILAELDRKIDDGRPNTGSFQFSRYESNGSGAPTDGSPTAPSCTSALDASAMWNANNGASNCGGASLL